MKPAHSPVEPPRALVVEDEVLIAEELSERLTRLGLSVVGAVNSAEDALEAALREKPDLILMDIRLKGQHDGVYAAEEIRKRMKVPIIYITAYSDRTTLDRAKCTHPYGYVLKPFHERELQVTIEMAMYRHSLEEKGVSLETHPQV
jgi:CheY-like chemotaxis protein